MGKGTKSKRKASSSEGSRSRKRSPSKRRKSPSKSKDKKKKDRSPDRARNKKVRSRSASRGKKRVDKKKKSPSRKRSASKKQSASPSKQRSSPSLQRKPSPQKTGQQSNGAAKAFAAAKAPPQQEPPGARRDDSDGARLRHESPEAGAEAASPGSESDGPKVEKVTVKLGQRPFGMNPRKEQTLTGYIVSKVADGMPADKAGVKPGWHLVKLGDKHCSSQDWDAVQTLLKNASLPAIAVFERTLEPEAGDAKDSADGDEDEEVNDFDMRADQRRSNDTTLGNIDDLPVRRDPEGLPPPITSWQDACGRGLLDKGLVTKLMASGLKRPTLIQRHAIPIIGHENGHHDLIALAQTGSGKTFAFVIPTVARLIMHGAQGRPFFPGKSPGCPLILCLSPTRELAMQTHKEIEVMVKGTSPLLLQVCIYGGESIKFQAQRVEKTQIDICCATPGRLIDLIDTGKVSLSFIQSVILDEADQMLEQSLEVMVAEILTGRDMPQPSNGRQSLLFSATMPQKIKELCPRILRGDRIANLQIGHYGEENKGGSCESIKQILKWVPEESHRVHAMVEDLRSLWMGAGKKGRVVIFTNQRMQASMLAARLEQNGISCLHLHGKLDQHIREEVFDKFRKGLADVLVATNVASRGLDFPDIAFVVQYNLPAEIDIYTHRIGRTGRIGQVGCALSYMGPKDRHLTPKLIAFLELNKQEVPEFLRPRAPVRGPSPRGYGRRPRSRSRRR